MPYIIVITFVIHFTLSVIVSVIYDTYSYTLALYTDCCACYMCDKS